MCTIVLMPARDQPGGSISGGALVTGTGTPTPGRGAGALGSGGGAFGSGGGGSGGGGGVNGRMDCASVVAAVLSTGLVADPSHTTNQRSGVRWLRGAPAGGVDPTTPAQIWPLGLVVSVNFTS